MKRFLTFVVLIFSLQSIAQTSDSYGDNDGDGVRNSFDKCPKTAKGVSVDSHGCPKDTDGDGVADYLDKQLITPTECQPSDGDGIGDCPCRENCGYIKRGCQASISTYFIVFSKAHVLDSVAKRTTIRLAQEMRSNPNIKVLVSGFQRIENEPIEMQLAWDKVNCVINHLVDVHGLDRGRFIFDYRNIGEPYIIKISSAAGGQSGPSNVPPPYPELHRIKK